MGARIDYIFKHSETEASVVLYSHWGADSWEHDLAHALKTAEPRQGDYSYYTRIAISSLIGDQWNSETGFGIYTMSDIYDTGNTMVIVNLLDNTITEQARDPHPIDAFINYHLQLTTTN
jgi:hypothetical protein